MIKVESITFNPFQENTYILSNASNECLIVDPGNSNPDENNQLVHYIEASGYKPKKIINTHCHIDHVLGAAFTRMHFNIEFCIPENEREVFEAVKSYAAPYGFPMYASSTIDALLHSDDIIRLGEDELKIIDVPGHSPGHVVFYHETQKILIGGDVLFRDSIGRTDLPGGDHNTLISNIRNRLFTLPDDVVVYPGHGPETTIGYEKIHNPFLN
jgi:glyoxylase-like metal-dependent hydrolase (beta-lactamase superfamily II)